MIDDTAQNSAMENSLLKMRLPKEMTIIVIDITNKCDLGCSNCTRLLENQDKLWEMTPDNFRLAVQSLKNFPGTVGIIGGNPAMHRNFVEICNIFAEEFPDKSRRGLWTNNIFKHEDIATRTFGGFNLNAHNSQRGKQSLRGLKSLKIGNYYDGNSVHAPLLTAVKDLFPEDEMWGRISKCDINQEWSASIVQNNGVLRGYFCEVAASFDLARGTDHGKPIVSDWWKGNIDFFKDQITHFCPGCGVPAKLKGTMDELETDTYTSSNSDLAEKSARLRSRNVVRLEANSLEFDEHKVTLYSHEARSYNKQRGSASKFSKFKNQVRRVIRNLAN